MCHAPHNYSMGITSTGGGEVFIKPQEQNQITDLKIFFFLNYVCLLCLGGLVHVQGAREGV